MTQPPHHRSDGKLWSILVLWSISHTWATMNKTILMLLLAAMSNAAMAEWVRIGSDDVSDHYVDPSTIRKNGKAVKMWGMTDYKEPRVENFGTINSTKSQWEHDCTEERNRLLFITVYSGHMGSGKRNSSASGPSNWEPIIPGTVGETSWGVACGNIKLKQMQ